MKHLLLAASCAFAMVSCQAPPSGTLGIFPATQGDGIRYKRHSAAKNEVARQRIAAAFGGGPAGVEKLMSEALLCGSGCWSRTDTGGLVATADFIPAVSKTPVQGGFVTRKGAIVRTAKGRQAVAKALSQMVGTKPTVRAMTQSELETFWAIIPYDLEDPVLVVEGKGHRLVLDFGWSKSKNILAHVEDLASIKL